MDVDKMVNDEIKKRSSFGKTMAKKFPELKGLTFKKFLVATAKLGMELDFVTACEMHDALDGKQESAEDIKKENEKTYGKKGLPVKWIGYHKPKKQK